MRRRLSLAILLALAAPAPADEPNVLPPPQPAPAPPAVIVAPLPPAFYRPSAMAHWENYAVDRSGFFRPRVVFAPQPYYAFNGQPYPWPIRPERVMPYLTD
jgi:hypothetical protein